MIEIHGEFSSVDATALSEANSRFKIFKNGELSELALVDGDVIVVGSTQVAGGASGLNAWIFEGVNATVDDGELIALHAVGTNASLIVGAVPQLPPRILQPIDTSTGAGIPKVKSDLAIADPNRLWAYFSGWLKRASEV